MQTARIAHVLGAFDDSERAAATTMIERGADAVQAVIAGGARMAMNSFNRRGGAGESPAGGGDRPGAA